MNIAVPSFDGVVYCRVLMETKVEVRPFGMVGSKAFRGPVALGEFEFDGSLYIKSDAAL